MALSKKDRKQILRNYPGRSIKELAGELGASQKEVRQVLESAGIEIREDKQKLLFSGFARVQPFAIAIIVTAVSLVYLNSIRNGFHYDDIHSLLENLEVRVEWEKNPESRDLFLRYFWHPEYFSSRPNVAMPRPLLMCTFAFNYLIGKYEPLGWVLVNIFLHMMNSVIIYIGITHLTGKTRIALLTALLFAIHPVNTETVNYINCRSESLTTLFMLLTMYFFSRSLREDRLDLRIACFLVFAMGLLTKELAIVLPATLFAIDFLFIWPLNKDRISIERRLLGWYLPVAAVWLAYMGYREILLGHTVVEKAVRPVMENFLTQTRVLVRYIRIMFLPLHLNISYENMDLLWVAYEFKKDPLIGGGVFPSIALLATLVGLMAAWCRKHPVISFAIANFFITLSITSVVPLNAVMNDHRMYLPSLGVCILLAGLFDRTASYMRGDSNERGRWPALVQAPAVALLVLFALLTIHRNFSYHTDLTVWRDSIRKSPEKAQVVSDLGNAYYRGGRKLISRGEFVSDGKIDAAERAEIYQVFRKEVPVGRIEDETEELFQELYVKGLNRAEQLYLWGIRFEPNYYKAWHNLGTINYTYAQLDLSNNDREAAMRHLRMAIGYFNGASKISPNGESFNDGASARLQLAKLTDDEQARQKLLEDAEKYYLKGIELNPALYKGYINVAIIKSMLDKSEEALPYVEQAIRINPVEPQLHFYKGRFLLMDNRRIEAVQAFEKCLQISPGFARCKQGLEAARQRMEEPLPEPTAKP